MAVYCGIDWAEGHHDIALIDSSGALVAKRRVNESLDGVAEFTAMLAAAGDSAEDPIPVAIETPRGLLVAVLRATGRPIYPINPLAVARYRERTSVSGKKSDHVDAMALANILRTDAHLHRSLPDDSALARSITVLARAYQDGVWRRTKLVQELRARLREFYSGFLAAFAAGSGSGRGLSTTQLASNDARAVLAIAPSPADGLDVSKARVETALRCAAPRRAATARGHTCRERRRRTAGPAAAPGPHRGAGDAHRNPRVAGRAGRDLLLGRSARGRTRRGVHPASGPRGHHQLPRVG